MRIWVFQCYDVVIISPVFIDTMEARRQCGKSQTKISDE